MLMNKTRRLLAFFLVCLLTLQVAGIGGLAAEPEAIIETAAPPLTEAPAATETFAETAPPLTEAPAATETFAETTPPPLAEAPTAETAEATPPPEAEAVSQALLSPASVELPLGGATSELFLHARDGVQHAMLTLPSAGYLTVTMSAAGRISLLRNGTVLMQGDSVQAWLSAGAYDLEIRGDGSNTVMRYIISTSWRKADADNDTRDRAAPLELDGRSHGGVFTRTAKESWWTVELPSDGYLLLQTKSDIQPLYLALIRQSSGERVLTLDSALEDDPQTEIGGAWLSAGSYWLCASADTEGSFALWANFTAMQLGNVRREASKVATLTPNGVDVSAALTPASSQHYYTFTLARQEKVTLTAYAYLSTLHLYLYDGTGGTLLANGSASGTSGKAGSPYAHTIETKLPAGTYRVQVGAAANGPYGVYQMLVKTNFMLSSLSLSANLIQEGDSLTVTCGAAGGTPTFYQYQLWKRNEQGSFEKLSEKQAGATTTFAPGAGVYKIMGVISDGTHWASLYSDIFVVKAIEPLSITSVNVDRSTLKIGQTVQIFATFGGERPLTQMTTQIFDANNQVVANLVSTVGTVAYVPTAAGTFRIMVVGTDGVNWVSKWGPSFTVGAPETLRIASVWCNQADSVAGAPLLVECAYTGTPNLWVYEVYRDGQLVQSLQPGASRLSFTPASAGSYRVMAVCSDGSQWASCFSNTFRVVASAAPLAISALTPNTTSAQAGEQVTFNLHTTGGQGLRYTEYQLYHGGTLIQAVSGCQGSATFELSQAGSYYAMAVANDGQTWVAKFSESVTATGSKLPFAIDDIKVSDTAPMAGTNIVYTASCANGIPLQYTFELYQDGKTLVKSVNTANNTWVCNLPSSGRYTVMVVATDGVNWVSKWGPTIDVGNGGSLSISTVSASAATAVFGEAIRFQPSFVGGKKVLQTVYEVYDAATGVRLSSTSGNSAVFDLTPSDPAIHSYRVMAVATDGVTWASKWSDPVTFILPTALNITDVTSDLTEGSVTAGTPVTFTATVADGLPLRQTAHEIFYRANASGGETRLDSIIGNSTVSTYIPNFAGQYRVMFVAFDGITWVSRYSDWITVAPKSQYRALVVGQAYAGTVNELQGTTHDAKSMEALLSSGNLKDPYRVTRRTDLTSTGILNEIRSAFADATSNDVSLFFYSGHGSTGGVLVGTDLRGITPSQLRNCLDTIPGTKIVIVDACNSGGLIGKEINGADAENKPDSVSNDAFDSAFIGGFLNSAKSSTNLADNNYYVIVAAHSTELSYEGTILESSSTARMGFFTYGVTKGCGWNPVTWQRCTPYADTNGNSALSLHEIYTYAYGVAVARVPSQHAQVYPENCDFPVLAY